MNELDALPAGEPWTFALEERDEQGRAAGRDAVVFTAVGAVAIVAGATAYLLGPDTGEGAGTAGRVA
jgi:hypothetical protein